MSGLCQELASIAALIMVGARTASKLTVVDPVWTIWSDVENVGKFVKKVAEGDGRQGEEVVKENANRPDDS